MEMELAIFPKKDEILEDYFFGAALDNFMPISRAGIADFIIYIFGAIEAL